VLTPFSGLAGDNPAGFFRFKETEEIARRSINSSCQSTAGYLLTIS
jgi:hypothetical protein